MKNLRVYLAHLVSSFWKYTLYTRLGDTLFGSYSTVTKSFGISNQFNYKRNFRFTFVYEYSHFNKKYNSKRKTFQNNWNCHFVNMNMNLTLPNSHKINMRGRFNPILSAKKTFEFLLTYSIPLNVPYKKKRTTGIKGKIKGSDNIPFSDMNVFCSKKHSITDEKGEFCFTDLEEGTHFLSLGDILEKLIPQMSFPLKVEVTRDVLSNIEIEMLKFSSLSGKIHLYKLNEKQHILSEQKLITDKDESLTYVKDKPAKNILLQVVSDDEQDAYQIRTEEDGKFDFYRLRPGKWFLRIIKETIPNGYSIENNKISFEAAPGEHKSFDFKVLPIIRHMQMMEME